MHTSCMENECFDEYDSIAECSVQLMEKGMPFDAALHQVSEMFFEDMINNIDFSFLKSAF